MTESKGTATLPEAEKVSTLDLDALEVDASYTIKIGGQVYAVRGNLDIPMEEIEETLSIQRDFKGLPWHEQLRRARRQVRILVPDLPDEVLNKMTGRQIIRVMASMLGMAPMGEKEEPAAAPVEIPAWTPAE
jgi:hypothetical protein